jgi:hypothetical protein
MNDTTQTNSGLASLLESRLMEWEKARDPQKLKMLECYQDVMRIPREDDTSGTGAARAKKAKPLFIGSTRNKVRASRAKINDALFGNGEMPFDTTPKNEKLKQYSDLMEKIITDQMERGGFKPLLKSGVNTLATYGTGFVFGPFVRKEELIETSVEMAGPSPVLKEEKFEFDLPYFELGNTLDVVPDPEARGDMRKGMGVFWATMESKHTIKALKGDKRYKDIDLACVRTGDNGNQTGGDEARQLRGNVDFWFDGDRVKLARYFGKVPKSMLSDKVEDSAVALDSAEADDDLVDAIVVMAGGVVIRAEESPYKKAPAHRCLYEAVDDEMWGVGVAENNAPHQKVTNAAFRLFMEGKGMALLGTSSVDRSKFLATEDFKKFPGKVYQVKPGLTPDERKEAIQHHIEPDITGGWIDVIRMSEQFSDDDTGITKYTQGDDSRNLNKTASGISMIMSASSLPIKEVIQNIDGQWIEPIVECYIDWNLKYLEPETVEKIFGPEDAKLWAQIKQFGKASFMDWKATGTSSFMQKEVLTNKIRAFADFVLSNPATSAQVDVKELLRQTWDVMEIGRESPILEDEAEMEIPPQIKAQMEQMSEQLKQAMGALENAGAEVDKLEAGHELKARELKIKEVEANTKAYDAVTKRLQALGPLLNPVEVQQLATETQAEAMAQPDPGMPPSDTMEVPEPSLEQLPEMAEPMQEVQEPPGLQEPQSEQPAEAGFFTPEQPV